MIKLHQAKKTLLLITLICSFSMCHSVEKDNPEKIITSPKAEDAPTPKCIWIVTFSGWGLEDGEKRIQAYKTVAKKWDIDIELSSRLGTLDSNKYAPSVAKEIMNHNGKTFACYEERFGKTWQQKFSKEIVELMAK